MIELLLRKLRARDAVSAEEEQVLRDAVARVEDHGPDSEVVREGMRQGSSRLLIEGLVARVKTLENGRRQITELHVGGDFVDLHSFLLKRLDHSIVTVTRCRIGVVPHEVLADITRRRPHLARLLWLMTLIDAAIQRQWLAVMGQLPAGAQIAHLLCELYVRLEVVGLANGHSFELPLTQEEMGEVCGLTSVHVNRSLQQLRAQGLVEWQRGRVTIPDWPRLARHAHFETDYLNLRVEPR